MSRNIEYKGHMFRVGQSYDEHAGAPWEDYDGVGVIRKASYSHGYSGDKKPGERPMNQASRHEWQYYYDWQATMKKAKEEGWGLIDEAKAELEKKLGRKPTAGEVLQASVERDFKYCSGYVNGDWNYVVLSVYLLDDEGNVVEEEFLGGVEDLGNHAKEMAEELMDTLLAGKLVEDEEINYWAERGIMTLGEHPQPYLG